VDEMLDNLSESQEEMLMYAIKDSFLGTNRPTSMIDDLAHNADTLAKLTSILKRVKSR
jgi:hypothetical protein